MTISDTTLELTLPRSIAAVSFHIVLPRSVEGFDAVCGARAFLGGALSAPGVTVSMPLTSPSRDGARLLLRALAVRRDGARTESFALASSVVVDDDKNVVMVAIHPEMRTPEAVGDVVAALISWHADEMLGRLGRLLWGRWDEEVSWTTEELMVALGAEQMRFSDFRERVVEKGVGLFCELVDTSADVSYRRSGQGGKVVSISFSVGPRPAWWPAPITTSPPAEAPKTSPAPLGYNDRVAFYRLIGRAISNGWCASQVGFIADVLGDDNITDAVRWFAAMVRDGGEPYVFPFLPPLEERLLVNSLRNGGSTWSSMRACIQLATSMEVPMGGAAGLAALLRVCAAHANVGVGLDETLAHVANDSDGVENIAVGRSVLLAIMAWRKSGYTLLPAEVPGRIAAAWRIDVEMGSSVADGLRQIADEWAESYFDVNSA